KLAGEKNVLAAQNRHLIVRVSWVFGPDRPSFIDGMIKRAQENETVDAIADKFSTPTYTHDIAKMLPQFFDGYVEDGILHFASAGKCSWQEYAQWALDCCREFGVPMKAKIVGPIKLNDMQDWVARRPPTNRRWATLRIRTPARSQFTLNLSTRLAVARLHKLKRTRCHLETKARSRPHLPLAIAPALR